MSRAFARSLEIPSADDLFARSTLSSDGPVRIRTGCSIGGLGDSDPSTPWDALTLASSARPFHILKRRPELREDFLLFLPLLCSH